MLTGGVLKLTSKCNTMIDGDGVRISVSTSPLNQLKPILVMEMFGNENSMCNGNKTKANKCDYFIY